MYNYIIYTSFSKLQNIFGNPALLSLFKSKMDLQFCLVALKVWGSS